jgi:hypothetical protein
MNGEMGTFLQEIAADPDRRSFSGVVGVGLEGEAEHGDRLALTVPNRFCTTRRAMRYCCQVLRATTCSQ